MEVVLLPVALDHLEYWKKSGNKKAQARITELIKDILQHPFSGIGKPEPLRFELSGKWSRRITKEHRLVYAVQNNIVYVYSMKGHY
ncbi:MAG: Txe/YoeB family addiction module toxin [Bacteroidota bacterium]